MFANYGNPTKHKTQTTALRPRQTVCKQIVSDRRKHLFFQGVCFCNAKF